MTAGRPPVVLSERDQAILADLACVRLLTGRQLERRHFVDLDPAGSRGSSRRRTMHRLTSLHLVMTLDRRVGGDRAGSAGLVYSLDAGGQRWLAANAHGEADDRRRLRRPWAIGPQFVAHTLDVAELYVRLRERERTDELTLVDYLAEPASWHHSVVGLLKPDAYAVWITNGWEQHRWIEVDRATESLPTLRRKLLAYVDTVNSGDSGPAGVVPRVIVSLPDSRRLTAVRGLVDELPLPAASLITVQLLADLFTPPASSPAGARPPPP